MLLLPFILAMVAAQTTVSACRNDTFRGTCNSTNPLPGANTCLNDAFSRNYVCTAQDSPIGNVVACVRNSNGSLSCDGKNISFCVLGETTIFLLNLTVQANADRYDVGVFINPNGTSARTGGCCKYILAPTTVVNGNDVNATGGCGPYRNFDNDTCGDIKANELTYAIIEVPLKCQGSVGSTLNGSFCTVWTQQSNSDCFGPESLKPGTGSKCKCSLVNIGNVFVAGMVTGVNVTGPTCYTSNATLTYGVTAMNGNADLKNVNVTTNGQLLSCCAGMPNCNSPSTSIVVWAAGALLYCNYTITSPSMTGYLITATVAGTDSATGKLVTQSSSPFTVVFEKLDVDQTLTTTSSGLASFLIKVTNLGSANTTVAIVNTNQASSSTNCSSSVIIASSSSYTCQYSYNATKCYAVNNVTVTTSVCAASAQDRDCARVNNTCVPSTACSCINGVCNGPSNCTDVSPSTSYDGLCNYTLGMTGFPIPNNVAEACSV